MSLPLPLIVLTLAAGVLCGDVAPPGTFPALPLGALVCLTGLSLLLDRAWAARGGLLGLFFCAGLLAQGPAPDPLSARFLLLDAPVAGAGSSADIYDGVVEALLSSHGDRSSLQVTVTRVCTRGGCFSVHARVLVSIVGHPPLPDTPLRFQTRFSRFVAQGNPHEPDPRDRARRQGLVRRGFVGKDLWRPYYRYDPERPVLARSPLKHTLLRLREHIHESLQEFYRNHGGRTSGLMIGLALGERTDLSDALREKFSNAGLAHLLAISGSHFALVALALERLLSRLLPMLPGLRFGARALRQASLMALLAVVAYGHLVGLNPAIGRALLISGGLLGLRAQTRRVRAVPLLTLAMFILLSLDPTALWDIGAQLSVASVFALVTLTPRALELIERLAAPLTRAQERNPSRLRATLLLVSRGLGALVATNLIATLATAPICAFHFRAIPLVGLLANVLAVPLLGALSLGPLLVGGMLQLIAIPGASLCLWPARRALEIGLTIGETFGDPLRFPAWHLWLSPLQVGLCLGVMAGLSCSRQVRRIVPLVGVGLLLVGWLPAFSARAPLKVTMLNIGHGDATVLQLPGGQVVLIDGGGNPPGSSSRFDPGKHVLLPFLKGEGIQRIDLMILSHPHPDHLGGLLAIAERLPVQRLWVAERPDRAGSFQTLIETLEHQGTRIDVIDRGSSLPALGPVRVRCLHPIPGWEDGLARKRDRSVNNGSLVLEFTFGEVDLLFTGDIEEAVEAQLVESGMLRPVELMKAPHHGSDTSSTEPFVRATRPAVVWMGVGLDNQYGFPRREVSRRWALAGASVYRTDRDGALELSSDGRTLKVMAWHPGGSRPRLFDSISPSSPPPP